MLEDKKMGYSSKNAWETEVEYRNTLQQILDSGIFTYQHERDALEYAIFLINQEICGEAE